MTLPRCPAAVLAALLLLTPAVAPAAEPKPTRLPLDAKDLDEALTSDWYGLYFQGKKIGYGNDTLRKVGDGPDARVVATMRVEMKVRSQGADNETSFFETKEFEAQPPYRLVRGSFKLSNGNSTQEISVRRKGDGYEAVVDAAGEKNVRRLAALDLTLEDQLTPMLWLRRGAKVGEQVTTRGFDLSELKPKTERRKLLQTKTSVAGGVPVTFHELDVLIVEDDLKGLERADARGKMLSGVIGGVFEMRLEPEKQAKDIRKSVDLFVLGMVKIDRKLGLPHQVKGLVLEATGSGADKLKDGPFQQVVRQKDGKVLVKVGRDFAGPVKATDAEIKENLEETTTYLTTHPKVEALVKRAVGNATTPREKVEKIVRFVGNYIKGSYTAEPLTLLDLLNKKEGDCTEYALLTTTLCRAAGIPARDVGGLIYMGDGEKAFGGHAWTEVVLDGHWVPVDASWKETDVNACHIRFGTGSSGLVEQLATFGNLSFKLVEVQRKK